MAGVVNILIAVVVWVVMAILVYRIVYTYQINKKIQSGQVSGRKLVDLSRMIMISVSAGLAIFSILLMYIIYSYKNEDNSVPRNKYAVIDVSDDDYRYVSYFGNNESDDASYAQMYSKEANAGYNKEVIKSGQYTFTVFRRSSSPDDYHPDFLCYVDYTGADSTKYVAYNSAGFKSIADDSNAFLGESGGDIVDSILYIGYLDAGCEFNIVMSLLDEAAEVKYNQDMQNAYEEDKGQFPQAKEYAISTSEISISIE